MKIYEIPAEMRKALDNVALDEDSGEILNAEELDAVQEAAEKKIEATCLYLREQEADIDGLMVEIDRLQRRMKSLKKRNEWLKERTRDAVNSLGGKVKTNMITASIRHTKAVQIEEGASLPEAYTTVKTTITPNKMAIKQALEAGTQIHGCSLVVNESLSIR